VPARSDATTSTASPGSRGHGSTSGRTSADETHHVRSPKEPPMKSRPRSWMVASLAVGALVLAGCGGGGGSSSGGKTKIVVWDGYEDAQGKSFTALIAKYNQEHPDV